MTPEFKLQTEASIARALIKMNAYIAENRVAEIRGEYPLRDAGDFLRLIDEENIGCNDVIEKEDV